MNYSNTNNPLDELAFEENLDFQTLENILECLDHVTPKKVSREEFNLLNGDFLDVTGEDRFGKKYDLFLPSDLNQGEKLNFIFFLSQKFGLEDYTPYGRIITQVKVMIAIILRNTKEEDKEEYLELLASKYNLSEEFVDRIKKEKMILSEAKEMVRGIKLKRGETERKKRLGSDEDVNIGYEKLKKLFGEQFYLTFFRKGIDMLRLGMMTITQAEQEEKIRYFEESGYKKEVKLNGTIEYTKGDEKGEEIIQIHLTSEKLDEEERLLRDKIGIAGFKERLEVAKISGDKKEIAKIELEASNSIIKALYEYMYQNTINFNGYQPSKILEHKEIQCIGYSLLGHAFLTELGIEHNGLDLPDHSALEVIIGGTKYYFDATGNDQLLEFEYGEKIGEYSKINGKGWIFGIPQFAIKGNPEKILLSHIFNNKGTSLLNSGRYKESKEMFDSAIELNPTYTQAYYNKGTVLLFLERYEEAIVFFDKAIEIDPSYLKSYDNKGFSLYQLGRYKETIEVYDRVIELDPTYTQACYNKGTVLLFLERYEEAIEMFDRAIELNPTESGYYYWKGIVLGKRGKRELGELYKYSSYLLEGKQVKENDNYTKEKQKIKQYIESKDHELIIKYLIELEKDSNYDLLSAEDYFLS